MSPAAEEVKALATEDPAPMPSPPAPLPALPSIEEIAPNAAKLIATPGSEKETSPLSVFARMMAKVIRDTKEELTKSAVKARATELMVLAGRDAAAAEERSLAPFARGEDADDRSRRGTLPA